MVLTRRFFASRATSRSVARVARRMGAVRAAGHWRARPEVLAHPVAAGVREELGLGGQQVTHETHLLGVEVFEVPPLAEAELGDLRTGRIELVHDRQAPLP